MLTSAHDPFKGRNISLVHLKHQLWRRTVCKQQKYINMYMHTYYTCINIQYNIYIYTYVYLKIKIEPMQLNPSRIFALGDPHKQDKAELAKRLLRNHTSFSCCTRFYNWNMCVCVCVCARVQLQHLSAYPATNHTHWD